MQVADELFGDKIFATPDDGDDLLWDTDLATASRSWSHSQTRADGYIR